MPVGLRIDFLALLLMRVDDDATGNIASRAVDATGPLHECVDGSAFGQKNVVINVKRYLDNLRRNQETRRVLVDLPLDSPSILEDELRVVASRFEVAQRSGQRLALLDRIDDDQDATGLAAVITLVPEAPKSLGRSRAVCVNAFEKPLAQRGLTSAPAASRLVEQRLDPR